MLFSILILLFYNLQQVSSTNDKLDETALYKLILDQCVDKPELSLIRMALCTLKAVNWIRILCNLSFMDECRDKKL
uniref:Uncharacterized protein n=1 Tax=Globodera rostochiensis TaxID=31243 RepID=A0A914I5X6_GLORO